MKMETLRATEIHIKVLSRIFCQEILQGQVADILLFMGFHVESILKVSIYRKLYVCMCF